MENFPFRLRGIFAFVTLSNGTIVAVDVDDWDAPCRRPDPMVDGGTAVVSDLAGVPYTGPLNGMTGSLDIPQTGLPASLDPFGVPLSYNSNISESAGTTLEAFFPVSQPNRLRSNFLLRNDPTSGLHQPNIINQTQLFDVNGTIVATGTQGITTAPLLLPTPLSPGFVDPTYITNPTEPNPNSRNASNPALASAASQTAAVLLPGSTSTAAPSVRLSFDDPTAQQDQNWQVTYEGALPTIANIAFDIATYDGYQTLTMASGIQDLDAGADASFTSTTAPSPALCSKGIEDWTVGQQRATQVVAAISAAGLPAPGAGAASTAGNPTLPQWTSDYVEIADDLLGSGDPYWAIPTSPEQDCWDPPLADTTPTTSSPHAQDRYNACSDSVRRRRGGRRSDRQRERGGSPFRARLADHPGVRRPPGPRPLRLVSERRERQSRRRATTEPRGGRAGPEQRAAAPLHPLLLPPPGHVQGKDRR